MQTTITDLRYHMNDVLKALDRYEEVTILYHGKPKGVIKPIQNEASAQSIANHPFFGMYADDEQSVQAEMDKLRGGRYRDL